MSTYKELAGLKIKTVTSDPSNPLLGEMWYNSTAGSIKVRTFAPGSWTAGNPAPGSYMTFAGCGTKAAYIKTMGNDGTPAPNPLGNDSLVQFVPSYSCESSPKGFGAGVASLPIVFM